MEENKETINNNNENKEPNNVKNILIFFIGTLVLFTATVLILPTVLRTVQDAEGTNITSTKETDPGYETLPVAHTSKVTVVITDNTSTTTRNTSSTTLTSSSEVVSSTTTSTTASTTTTSTTTTTTTKSSNGSLTD